MCLCVCVCVVMCMFLCLCLFACVCVCVCVCLCGLFFMDAGVTCLNVNIHEPFCILLMFISYGGWGEAFL